jgi:5-methylcytosine-specific restriction endonuclease McrA
MDEEWTIDELRAATRAYMWMLRSAEAGTMPNKAAVARALIDGPLSNRPPGTIDPRMMNISHVLHAMGRKPLKGYVPAPNVGPNVFSKIQSLIEEYENGGKSQRRVHFLVSALPPETVAKAASELASGTPFDYPDSTTYDAHHDGAILPPKAVIGYAALLYYRAPLMPEDFSGGEGMPSFDRLRKAGIILATKFDPEEEQFRDQVKKRKRKKLTAPPAGNPKPAKVPVTSTAFVRDPAVVAFVEQRAGGKCELCGCNAPFIRVDGEPFLEVHHIDPLAEEGPDTVDNAAGLCPNCHRKCHHSADAAKLRSLLKAKFCVQ